MLDHLLPSKPNNTNTKPVASEGASNSAVAILAKKQKLSADLPVTALALAKNKSAANTSSGVLSQILAIIGQEVGLEPSELKADSEFADLGIDSLLSLTITSKIRGELGLDYSPSLFVDQPTVGDLRALVEGGEDDDLASVSSSSESSSDDESVDTQITSSGASVYQDTPQEDASSSRRTHNTLLIRTILAEETHVPIEELKSSTVLSDVGVDSLLSLTVSGKLQGLLNVDIPGTMFVECETLHDVEEVLCKTMGLDESKIKKPDSPSSEPPAIGSSLATTNERRIPGSLKRLILPKESQQQSLDPSSLPQATSILLCGSPKPARQILFLFPDGSGSASSYAALATNIDTSSVAVYGLNCPWRKTGYEMTRLGITMSIMVARYIVEVQRVMQQQQQQRQTSHASLPCVALGGWSAGGILALEAARQLQQQPEAINVSQLILFDSPNPIGLQNPPQRMYDFFDSLGIFGNGSGKDKTKKPKTPEWLRAHFDAFLRILDDYEPTPLPNPPASLIIYARDGVCKDPNGPKMETHPNDPREMLWLLNNRTDFSADGWGSILGSDNLGVEVLDEVNHFSLMDAGPKMKQLGEHVTKFVSVKN